MDPTTTFTQFQPSVSQVPHREWWSCSQLWASRSFVETVGRSHASVAPYVHPARERSPPSTGYNPLPTYRHSWRCRTLIANRLPRCRCPRVFAAPYISAVHGPLSLAGPSCSVFLYTEPGLASTSHTPRVILAGSLKDTEMTRNTPRPPARAQLLPERCAQCSVSCFRSAVWKRRLGAPGQQACPSLSCQFGTRHGYCAQVSPMYSM